MACLSELAYIRFNPPFLDGKRNKKFIETISKLVDEGFVNHNKVLFLTELINTLGYDPDEEREKLVQELGTIEITLVETFDRDGTQAILVSNDKIIALAFRGTESTSLQDIKADMKAKMTHCETGGKIHLGFKEAFEKVKGAIQEKINQDQFKKKPLFITGHSLEGALATIAAQELTHKGGIAACYTFGSPRVADEEWMQNIKTPLYRVVNAADCVTTLPPGADLIVILCWAVKYIPYIGEWLRSWLSQFGGYVHSGDMRYLTNCQRGKYEDVKRLYHVSLFRRIRGYMNRASPVGKVLADHSINIYRKKLMIIAGHRNQTK